MPGTVCEHVCAGSSYQTVLSAEIFEIKENLEFTLFSQKISTQPLTVLTMSVIVHLEQGKREKKKSSSDSFKIDTSDFSDSANITKSKLLFYERRYDL